MTEPSGYVLETLWEDAEFVLSRGVQDGETSRVLVLAPASVQPAPGKISRDAKQISGDRSLRGVIILRIVDQQHEYFLRHVLSRCAVAAHVPREPKDTLLIPFIKSAEGFLSSFHELAVQFPVRVQRIFHRSGRAHPI